MEKFKEKKERGTTLAYKKKKERRDIRIKRKKKGQKQGIDETRLN